MWEERYVRKLGVVLLGLGAFLIVMAPLLRFYAYPQLARAPQSQNTVSTLVGPGATIFDIGTLKEITTDLTTRATTVGDVNAAKKQGGNTVVWVTSSSTKSSDGVMRSRSVERVAFDATKATAVNCCGEFVSDVQGERTPVRHRGLQVKFPFMTEKKTYDWWDGTLANPVPIKYQSTTTVDGVKVYKFEQTIPATKVGTQDVPLSLLGLSGSQTVSADSMYSNHRTLWVEPYTGVVIKRQEQQDSTLNYNGQPRLTTSKVTTGFDAKTVKQNADKYGPQGTQLHLLRSTLPLVGLVVGILCLLAGLLAARGRRQAVHRPAHTRGRGQVSLEQV
jgi:hypothetical protein